MYKRNTCPPGGRRLALRGAAALASGLWWPAWDAAAAGTSRKAVNVLDLGADDSGAMDAAPAFQAAINQLRSTGGVLVVPAGTYRIARTLEWRNPVNGRMPGILFQGDGMNVTVLRSSVANGPLLRVRGVPERAPFSTTFFWGGGMRDLSLEGTTDVPGQDGVEVTGWWYGEIVNCRLVGFSRHGIRSTTALDQVANPDFSASTLFVKATWIERCGGWGFVDDGGVQGAPAWSWDRVVFVLCRQGGASVQSTAHSFTKCSFAGCGWSGEKGKPATSAYGLYFHGSLTAAGQHWVEGCEFDTNLSAHIGARYLSASSFVNNRFIFNDRYGLGRLCPASGIELGSGDAAAAVRGVEFRQSFFRFDRGGTATAYRWNQTANLRDIDVQGSVFADNSAGTLKLVRYGGLGDEAAARAMGYNVRDRE